MKGGLGVTALPIPAGSGFIHEGTEGEEKELGVPMLFSLQKN